MSEPSVQAYRAWMEEVTDMAKRAAKKLFIDYKESDLCGQCRGGQHDLALDKAVTVYVDAFIQYYWSECERARNDGEFVSTKPAIVEDSLKKEQPKTRTVADTATISLYL